MFAFMATSADAETTVDFIDIKDNLAANISISKNFENKNNYVVISPTSSVRHLLT